jgi:hypothetical protein
VAGLAGIQCFAESESTSFTLDLGNGRTFSSAAAGFRGAGFAPVAKWSLARSQHALEHEGLKSLFYDACSHLDGTLFVAVSPFLKPREKCTPPENPSDIGEHGAVWYQPNTAEQVKRFWDWRERCSAFEDWSIGVCTSSFDPPQDDTDGGKRWTTEALLTQAERIATISIFFTDANAHAVLARPFEKLASDLKQIGCAQ